MAKFYRVNDIATGFKTIVKKISEEGKEKEDEHGSQVREIRNLLVEIRNPLPVTIPLNYFWNGEKLEKYTKQFLDGDKQGFVYTYGQRLFAFPMSEEESEDVIDQINDNVIKRINNFEDTRRAIAVTWNPKIDGKRKDVPCLILVDFLVDDGVLHTTGVWRSHDIFGAWVPNVVGLTRLAQFVAENTGTEVGSITIHSINAHIYSVNYDDAKVYL